MKTNRKDLIIEAAIKRFSHFGFAKTTMNEIAEDLHITKANLYYYYADKMTLIQDVILNISSKIHAQEKIIISQGGTFFEIISKILAYRREMNQKYCMVQMSENLEWIKGLELESVFAKVIERDEQSVQQVLRLSIDAGELKEMDVKDVARTFLDIVTGLGFLCNISDIFRGIPNPNNAEVIYEKQIKATQLLYNGIKK